MGHRQTTSASLSRSATAGVLTAGYVALLYVIELLDVLLPARLDDKSVPPRSTEGLDGILLAPLLHGGWAHLIGNTVPLLVLGFLVGLSGAKTWFQVTAIIWIVGGVAVWLIGGENTNHIGASGVVFGWLAYLIVRGFFNRSPAQIALGIVVLMVYGGALWGVLPGRPGISWEGHLFGALAGAFAAWMLAERTRPRRAAR